MIDMIDRLRPRGRATMHFFWIIIAIICYAYPECCEESDAAPAAEPVEEVQVVIE